MEYTLTYSDSAAGWPSFYSFIPDWMIGMNNYFYTFKGGNLYRHNVNTNRNTFYYEWWLQLGNPDGAFTPSRVTSVFNDVPLEKKRNKRTLHLSETREMFLQELTSTHYAHLTVLVEAKLLRALQLQQR